MILCCIQVGINSRNHPYLLYALTVSGIAYLLRIRNVSAYKSSSVLPADDVIRAFDMRSYGLITSVAAMPSGCFIVGRNDGSVGCFQLGMLDPSAPGNVASYCFLLLVWPIVVGWISLVAFNSMKDFWLGQCNIRF